MRDQRQPELSIDSSVRRGSHELDRIRRSSPAAQEAIRGAEHFQRSDKIELVDRRNYEEDNAFPHMNDSDLSAFRPSSLEGSEESWQKSSELRLLWALADRHAARR
jgi:hypothetical protein